MTKKYYDIVAKSGEYQDQGGNDKALWTRCGVLCMDNGEPQWMKVESAVNYADIRVSQMVLDRDKAKGGGVMCSLFDRDKKEGGSKGSQEKTSSAAPESASGDDFDDDIPF
jgi:hypothetical protein